MWTISNILKQKGGIALIAICATFALFLLLLPQTSFAATDTKGIGYGIVEGISVGAAHGMMSIVSWFTWIAGVTLNKTIDMTVVDMSTHLKLEVFYVVWGAFRDLGNIVIIFSLLAVGIAVILGIENYGIKQLLPKIIIVALLINFSIFFTKAIIDAGNIVAIQFYSAIIKNQDEKQWDQGLTSIIMDKVQLTNIYKWSRDDSQKGNLPTENGTQETWLEGTAREVVETFMAPANITMIAILGSLLFIIAAFVFFAGAIALISRFVVLMFLIPLSALAFAAMILPATSKYWKMWLHKLLETAFFAPLYMMLLWASLFIISQMTVVAPGAKLACLSSGCDDGITIIVNYIVVCALLLGSLLIAKQLGLAGASMSLDGVKWMGGATTAGAMGLLGRNTIGRMGSKAAQNINLLNAASKGGINGFVARQRLSLARLSAGATFDARNASVVQKGADKLGVKLKGTTGGFDEKQEKKIAQHKKFADSLGKPETPELEENLENLKTEKDEGFKDPDNKEGGVEKAKDKSRESKQNLETKKQAVANAEREYQFAKDKKGVTDSELEEKQEATRSAQRDVETALNSSKADEIALAQAEKEFAAAKKKFTEDIASKLRNAAKELAKESNSRQISYAKEVVEKYPEPLTGVAKHYRESAVKVITKEKSKDKKLIDAIKAVSDDQK